MTLTLDDIKTARNTAYTAAWEQSQYLLKALKDDLEYNEPPFENITWAQLAYISRVINLLRRAHTNPEDE
jgi:hypothetical protein